MVTVNSKQILNKIGKYLIERNMEKIVDTCLHNRQERIARNIGRLVRGIITSGGTVISEAIRKSGEEGENFYQKLKKYYYLYEKSRIAIEKIYQSHLEAVGKELGESPVIVVDYTGFEKKYSQKIEYLQEIWDGSQRKIVKGIKGLVSCAQTRRGRVRVLKLEPSSSREEEFKSENNEVVKTVQRIHRSIGRKALYVMDRGMDRRKIMEPLLEEGIKFMIRLKTGAGCRHLEEVEGGRRKSVKEMIKRMSYPYCGPRVEIGGKEYETRLGVR